MAQVADRRLHTAEGRVHAQDKPGNNSDGQSGTETSFCASNSVIVIPYMLHTHSFVYRKYCIICAVESVVK
jgi:hypothetical protein